MWLEYSTARVPLVAEAVIVSERTDTDFLTWRVPVDLTGRGSGTSRALGFMRFRVVALRLRKH